MRCIRCLVPFRLHSSVHCNHCRTKRRSRSPLRLRLSLFGCLGGRSVLPSLAADAIATPSCSCIGMMTSQRASQAEAESSKRREIESLDGVTAGNNFFFNAKHTTQRTTQLDRARAAAAKAIALTTTYTAPKTRTTLATVMTGESSRNKWLASTTPLTSPILAWCNLNG